MDDVIKSLIEQMGVSGAIIVALAGYLVKKEIYFQKERTEFMVLLESKSNALVDLVKSMIASNTALEKEIYALRIEMDRESEGK